MANGNSLSQFDWRKLRRFTNAQALSDLDGFLDKLPQRAGQIALVAVSIMWVAAAGSVLLATSKSQELKSLQEEIAAQTALTPIVPKITTKPVSEVVIQDFIGQMRKTFPQVQISGGRNNELEIKAASTRQFSAWRTVIDNLTYAGQGNRLELKSLCVGRECSGTELQLKASLVTMDIILPDARPAGS